MLNYFIPDIYAESIFTINYKKLILKGIKCILFDLDNTLAPVTESVPDKKTKDLIESIKDLGFKIVIMSNSHAKRLEPFKNILCVDCSTLSKKPLKGKYLKIMRLYGLKKEEICAVGDQLITDVFGANRIGITSILVNPISLIDLKITALNRFVERKIIKKLTKKGLFEKGKYYE